MVCDPRHPVLAMEGYESVIRAGSSWVRFSSPRAATSLTVRGPAHLSQLRELIDRHRETVVATVTSGRDRAEVAGRPWVIEVHHGPGATIIVDEVDGIDGIRLTCRSEHLWQLRTWLHHLCSGNGIEALPVVATDDRVTLGDARLTPAEGLLLAALLLGQEDIHPFAFVRADGSIRLRRGEPMATLVLTLEDDTERVFGLNGAERLILARDLERRIDAAFAASGGWGGPNITPSRSAGAPQGSEGCRPATLEEIVAAARGHIAGNCEHRLFQDDTGHRHRGRRCFTCGVELGRA